MINPVTLSQIKAVLDPAQSVIIVLSPQANFDQKASAISLFRSLRDLKSEVSIVTPEELDYEGLVGSEDIKNKLGNKDLSVSFDYDENAVDKVSYHIDEDRQKFYLVIRPKKGHKPLSAKQVSFDYIGAQADVIFMFGVHNFEVLDHLYKPYVEVYDNATVVSVHNFETEIGDIKLDISGYSSWGEGMLFMIEQLGLEMDDESATNLLSAIEHATNRLSSYTTSADTFEVVAKLLRSGARRKPPVNVDQNVKTQVEQVSQFREALQLGMSKNSELPVELTPVKTSSNQNTTNSGDSPKPKKKKKKNRNNNQAGMNDKNYVPENAGRRV